MFKVSPNIVFSGMLEGSLFSHEDLMSCVKGKGTQPKFENKTRFFLYYHYILYIDQKEVIIVCTFKGLYL